MISAPDFDMIESRKRLQSMKHNFQTKDRGSGKGRNAEKREDILPQFPHRHAHGPERDPGAAGMGPVLRGHAQPHRGGRTAAGQNDPGPADGATGF